MGVVRPGDMGFDVIHLNLHKSFHPSWRWRPRSGPVGCKSILAPYLPKYNVVKDEDGTFRFDHAPHTIGMMRGFYGNSLVKCAHKLSFDPRQCWSTQSG
jgi:glycine dehydrogenase subunit 2